MFRNHSYQTVIKIPSSDKCQENDCRKARLQCINVKKDSHNTHNASMTRVDKMVHGGKCHSCSATHLAELRCGTTDSGSPDLGVTSTAPAASTETAPLITLHFRRRILLISHAADAINVASNVAITGIILTITAITGDV